MRPASLIPYVCKDERLRALLAEDGHTLRVDSARNLRDLGGYEIPSGVTRYGRFFRCGATRGLLSADLELLRVLCVTHVLDLRSIGESPELTCGLARRDLICWENVALYDVDISAATLMPSHDVDNYLVSSYLAMLSSTTAVRRIFDFLARVAPDDCALFHCAAGMDRTGIVAMLLLGLAGVSRRDIVFDYLLSFGTAAEVEEAMARHLRDEDACEVSHAAGATSTFASEFLRIRLEAIALVYDAVVDTYGSVRAYLLSCGIADDVLDGVRAHLVKG